MDCRFFARQSGAGTSLLLFLVLIGTFAGFPRIVFAIQDEKDPKPSTLNVSVVDKDKQPVAAAHVELRLWTGDWLETEFKGETDAKGSIQFEGVKPDAYSTILVTHPKFASSMQDFTIAAGENRTATTTLLPSVQSSIIVRSPDGELIVGAEITRLEVSSTDSGTKTFLNCDMFPMLTGRPKSEFKSDSSGRLNLPPLPTGSRAKITLVHPDWAEGELDEIEIVPGELATVMMKPGTNVTLKFHGDKKLVESLNGKEVSIHTFQNDGRPENRGSLIHKFICKDHSLKFCLPAGQYDAFYVDVKGLMITPSIPSSPTMVGFNDFAAENVTRNCVVRRTREIRGRVVTSDGKPVAGATLMMKTENLFVNSDEELVQLEKFSWSMCDTPVTDENGYYTAKVPDGKVRVDSQWSAYYSDPPQLEFTSDGETPIPDFVVHPMPTIKGTVVDDQGKKVSSAIVRVLSMGESNYVITDSKGRFSTKVSRFDYDLETKTRSLQTSLLVFDPSSEKANLVKVKFKDSKEYENMTVKISNRDPGWIEEGLKKHRAETQKLPKELIARIKRYREQSMKQFPDGVPGVPAPEIASGTWFNTDAKSLKDFRGQFVLLDFWFIGCGPCERDFPNLKLAHDLYGDLGFTVLSIHIPGQTPEQVKQFADARGLEYPLVVDSPEGEILNAYKKAGVSGYPSYILIGPDGKIIANDNVAHPEKEVNLSLRTDKLEAIHGALRDFTIWFDDQKNGDSRSPNRKRDSGN